MSTLESMGNKTPSASHAKRLKVEFRKLKPEKGTLIVVQSKDPCFKFTKAYTESLLETLQQEAVNCGANVVVISDDVTDISNVVPPDAEAIRNYYKEIIQKHYQSLDNTGTEDVMAAAYLEGWQAAIELFKRIVHNGK